MRLIDADALNRKDVNCANVPMNFIDTAPTVEAIPTADMIDILDEIKVEIEDIAFDWQEIDGEHESFMVVDLNDVLRIIDKYKAERSE